MSLPFIAGQSITLLGALFLLLAAVGVLRMPDVYNRMQAGTKATTLGTLLVLGGQALLHPAWTGKLLLLALFILLTNPISSHTLARAAHFIKIPLAKTSVKDALGESETTTPESHDD